MFSMYECVKDTIEYVVLIALMTF